MKQFHIANYQEMYIEPGEIGNWIYMSLLGLPTVAYRKKYYCMLH